MPTTKTSSSALRGKAADAFHQFGEGPLSKHTAAASFFQQRLHLRVESLIGVPPRPDVTRAMSGQDKHQIGVVAMILTPFASRPVAKSNPQKCAPRLLRKLADHSLIEQSPSYRTLRDSYHIGW